MQSPSQHRIWTPLRVIGFSFVLILMLGLLAACGSGDDEESTEPAGATDATATTGMAAEPTATEAATESDDEASPATSPETMAPTVEEFQGVSDCIQENTTAAMVEDLQAGDTTAAETVYTDCIEEHVPEAYQPQAALIADQAADCGTEAAQDLTDDDIAAIEDGDEETINQLTNATVECVTERFSMVGGMTGGADAEDLGAIATCFQDGTTAGMIEDLRAGDTAQAEEVYRGCLEENLPSSLVSQLDPIIELAGDCGVTAAEGLSEDEVAQIEQGDEQLTQRVTVETLECVSTSLGVDLQ